MELVDLSDSTPQEQKMPLDTFPAEILHQICTFFCEHCESVNKPPIDNGKNYNPNAGKKELRNLCLASRVLCNVAQPVLFHHFSFGRFLQHITPEAFRLVAGSFLTTLSEKPHLRGSVKELSIKTTRKHRFPVVPRRDSPAHANRHHATLIKRAGAEIGLRFLDCELEPEDLREAMVQLIIASCPNLAKVDIEIPRKWTFSQLLEWNPTPSTMHREPLGSVGALKTMVERQFNDQCRLLHHYCNQPAFKSLAEHALIFNSAARLETLNSTIGALESVPDMPRLETLTLDVRGSFSDLKSLFTKFPKLRHLTYVSSNKHGPLPFEINQALKNHHEMLEVLAIHFCKVPYIDLVEMGSSFGSTEFRLGLLNDFTRLKVLILDAPLIWRIRDVEESFSSEQPFQTISDTIPESLELICVHHLDMVSRPDYLPLIELVNEIRGGRFKALEHILWTKSQCKNYPNGLGYIQHQDDSLGSGAYHIGPVDLDTAVALKNKYPILMTMQINYHIRSAWGQ